MTVSIIRLALTPDGAIEATTPNPNYPRDPWRVVIDRRAPGRVIENNTPQGSDVFRWLVRAARQHVAP